MIMRTHWVATPIVAITASLSPAATAIAQDGDPVSQQTWQYMCEAFEGADSPGACVVETATGSAVSSNVEIADAGPDQPGDAGPPPMSDRWSFSAAPYLWLPSVKTEIATNGAIANPGAESTADFGDLLKELDFGFLGHLEARKQRWAVFADAVYLRISTNGQTNAFSIGPLAVSPTSIDVELEAAMLEFGGAYRVAEWRMGTTGSGQQNVSLEVLGGARVVSIDVDTRTAVELTGPLAQVSRQVKVDLSPTFEYVDPMVGARLYADVAPRWRLGLRGDVGGFGVGSKFTWNMFASASYRAWDNVDLLFGYRAMSFDLEDDDPRLNVELDVMLHGPLLAAVFHW